MPSRASTSGLGYDPAVAVSALCDCDPVLGRHIARIGPLMLKVEGLESPFSALVSAIVHQQLHGRAAASILGRVRGLFPKRRVLRPEDFATVDDADLRGAGLSRAKLLAVRDLAEKALDGTVPTLRALERMSDDEIVERLTAVRGIGRWTAEMLLIFRLGRPDVLPVDDYGVRQGFRRLFKKQELPTPLELRRRGERWAPYRSAAAWYLWRAAELPQRKRA